MAARFARRYKARWNEEVTRALAGIAGLMTAGLVEAATAETPKASHLVAGSEYLERVKLRLPSLRSDLAEIVRDFREESYERTREAHGFEATGKGRTAARARLTNGAQLQALIKGTTDRYIDTLRQTIVIAAPDGTTVDQAIDAVRRSLKQSLSQVVGSSANVLFAGTGSGYQTAIEED